jgi:hypothetical protein
MNRVQATKKCLGLGFTREEIAAEAERQKRTNPQFRNNMIRALQLHPWSNSREEWLRLAGALNA